MKVLGNISIKTAAILLCVASPGAAHAQAIFTTAPSSLSRVYTGSPQPASPRELPAPPVTANQAQAIPAPLPVTPRVPVNPQAVESQPAGSQSPVTLIDDMPMPGKQELVIPSLPGAMPSPLANNGDRNSGGQSLVPSLSSAAIPQETTSAPVLRHLTNTIQGFRFSGEIASSEWPVYLTAAQVRQKVRFQVGYLASVSVMPEASTLSVIINDTIVGRANIKTTHSVRTVAFDIPPGLLSAGFNSIRLTAEQRHRVDCSLQATYELWTQIDTSQTGLLIPHDQGVATLADLPALSPDAQGSLPVRAVIAGRTTLASVERIIRAVQIVSLAGRFEQPVVDIGPLAGGEYGLNLVVGTRAELAAMGEPGVDAGNGSAVRVLPARPNRRTTVVVTGMTDSQVNEALKTFIKQAEMTGAPAGLRAAAAFPGYRLESGQRVKLRDLGMASEEFSGRLFRAAFNVFMPPDFYPADYAKAQIDMAGGYSSGLSKSSQIVVSVNGRNAVSLKLSKSNGDVFVKNAIPLPLGALRPGLNRIEIEAQVPMASDAACDPLAAIAGTKRFLFLDSTEIELPRIARIARMPDLSVTTTGGFPFLGGTGRPRLVVPAPDRETVGAAATIAAHIAIAGGHPIDFELTGTAPPKGSGSGSVLVVGAANMLEGSYFEAAGIDPDMVRKAWGARFETIAKPPRDETLTRYEASARNRLVLERNFPSSCRMSKPPGGYERLANAAWRRTDMSATASIVKPRPPANRSMNGLDNTSVGSVQRNGPASGGLYEEWNAKIGEQSSVVASFKRYYDDTRKWTNDRYSEIHDKIGGVFEGPQKAVALTPRGSLVVAQNLNGDTANDIWTLISAPTSAELAESVQCLVDPRVWGQVSGRLSILDTSEGSVTAAAAESQRLVVTHPLTVENTRLIAAGWLSLNSSVYVALILLMALTLAISTVSFVRNVGRRHE